MKVGWKLGQQPDQGIVDNLVGAAEPTRQLAPLRGSQKELRKKDKKQNNKTSKLDKIPKPKYNCRNKNENEPDMKEPEGRSRPDAR